MSSNDALDRSIPSRLRSVDDHLSAAENTLGELAREARQAGTAITPALREELERLAEDVTDLRLSVRLASKRALLERK